MGRLSSTGYLLLIARKDGQLTYHRDLASEIAPAVVGDVLLPWSGRTRTLTGKDVVKVSLGTRDKKAALPRVDLARIRTIAEQAYHDVLARNDRGHFEPGFTTPVADLLAQLARRGGADYRNGNDHRRRDRPQPKDQVGFAAHSKRWVVERFFAWISRNRRLWKVPRATLASADRRTRFWRL